MQDERIEQELEQDELPIDQYLFSSNGDENNGQSAFFVPFEEVKEWRDNNIGLINSIIRSYIDYKVNSFEYNEIMQDVVYYKLNYIFKRYKNGEIEKLDKAIIGAIHNGIKNYLRDRNRYYKINREWDDGLGWNVNNGPRLQGQVIDAQWQAQILFLFSSNFTSLEIDIFKSYWLESLTQQQIESKLGCCQAKVSRTLKRMLQYLKDNKEQIEDEIL